MSYDLIAFRVPPGTSAEDALELAEHGEDRTPSASERAAMERLADALLELDPAAERTDLSDVIELDTPALQVHVYADQAAITIPYHHEGAAADAAMDRAFAYARVLATDGGYTVLDPQTEEIVEPGGLDRSQATRVYAETSAMVAGMAAGDADAPRWKFWRRR